MLLRLSGRLSCRGCAMGCVDGLEAPGGCLRRGHGSLLAEMVGAPLSTGWRAFDVRAVVRVHLEHAADALALVLDRVEDGHALFEHAGVNAREGEGACWRGGGGVR